MFWDAFRADPRWIELKERSEADGPLIEEIVSTYLTEPDYVAARRLFSGEAGCGRDFGLAMTGRHVRLGWMDSRIPFIQHRGQSSPS